MIISEKNLKDTCSFLVQELVNGRSTHADTIKFFRGLSLLFVGYREKQHIQSAIDQINAYAARKQKQPENANA
ncbi:hypothetical protein [Methylomonas sp. DH-1]|uniref:hypothetical protein n=1 Tax=Methylomonas sp. (strain DH-1) TaxID=1727196 RepID=UPI000B27A5BC|nr:hypothetical protein [Methylomonas sp. DH-1]